MRAQDVIEQMHIQRVNKLLTLRNDLDNKIIELSKKERDTKKTSGSQQTYASMMHFAKWFTGQTTWIKEGKKWLFLKKVYGRPLDAPPERSLIDKCLGRSQKPKPEVSKEELEAHEMKCEIEQIYEKLSEDHTALTPGEKGLLRLCETLDSMLWWLEGRPPHAFSRLKLFSGLGLLWAYNDEFDRQYNLARASQSRAAKDFMLRFLRGQRNDEFKDMLVKLHAQRRRLGEQQKTWRACLVGWIDCCGVWSWLCNLNTLAGGDDEQYPPEYLELRKECIGKLSEFKDDRCVMMFEEKPPGCCSRIFKKCNPKQKIGHGDHLSPEQVSLQQRLTFL